MSCKRAKDCNGENQRCQKYPKPVTKPFCGTNKCRRKRDCKDVGNRANGQNKARTCSRGRCLYNMDMDMDKGGFHLQLFDFPFFYQTFNFF